MNNFRMLIAELLLRLILFVVPRNSEGAYLALYIGRWAEMTKEKLEDTHGTK